MQLPRMNRSSSWAGHHLAQESVLLQFPPYMSPWNESSPAFGRGNRQTDEIDLGMSIGRVRQSFRPRSQRHGCAQ
eukprot:symbB.v1.2.040548.t1/scaffold7321.1/size11936/1